MKKFIFFLFCFCSVNIYSQDSSWVTISPENAYFTFRMPYQPVKFDSAGIQFYTYSVDSGLVMQVYYFKPDTAFPEIQFDSTNNPLNLFAAQLIFSTSGNLTELENINFQGQNVRESLMGKQIGISYMPAGDEFPGQVYLFTRVFFDGESFLAFYISAPAERIDDLLIYKNLFFQNTNILY